MDTLQQVINHIIWMHKQSAYPKWDYTDFWRLHSGYGGCELKL
mgnify:CR=1 FL=1